MRMHSPEIESNIHLERQIRDWARSGAIDAAQSTTLLGDIRVNVKRTNFFLRAVLFIFTVLIAAAAVALVAATGHLGEKTIGILCIISGILAFLLANILVNEFQLYRFGVEEGLAVISIPLISFGVGLVLGFDLFGHSSKAPWVLGITAGTLTAVAVCWRFGFQYAAALALVGIGMWADAVAETVTTKIALAAALLLAVAIVARTWRRRCVRDYLAAEFGAIETLAFVGTYLMLNVHLRVGLASYSTTLRYGGLPAWFYWFTYACIWILPVIGFILSLREKHRLMILASLGIALATLATNKPYLGREAQTWDAILFGLFLIGIAIAIKRWIAAGPGGYRHGYTVASLLQGDKSMMTALGTASVVLPGANTALPSHAESQNNFHSGGGYSGGAGASGQF